VYTVPEKTAKIYVDNGSRVSLRNATLSDANGAFKRTQSDRNKRNRIDSQSYGLWEIWFCSV